MKEVITVFKDAYKADKWEVIGGIVLIASLSVLFVFLMNIAPIFSEKTF